MPWFSIVSPNNLLFHSRLYSAYMMHMKERRREGSANEFHNLTAKAIKQYRDCFKGYTVRSCVYNVSLYLQTFPVSERYHHHHHHHYHHHHRCRRRRRRSCCCRHHNYHHHSIFIIVTYLNVFLIYMSNQKRMML